MKRKLNRNEKKIAELLNSNTKKLGIPKKKVEEMAKKLIKLGLIENLTPEIITPIQLPKKITLYHQIFDIVRGKTKSGCFGEIDFKGRKIIIDDRLDNKENKQEILYILIHEFSHYFIAYHHLEDSEIFADVLTQYILTIINQLNFQQK